jgi:hypothetical protein
VTSCTNKNFFLGADRRGIESPSSLVDSQSSLESYVSSSSEQLEKFRGSRKRKRGSFIHEQFTATLVPTGRSMLSLIGHKPVNASPTPRYIFSSSPN